MIKCVLIDVDTVLIAEVVELDADITIAWSSLSVSVLCLTSPESELINK